MRARTKRSHDAVRRGHSRITTVTLHNLADGAVGEVPVYDGFVGLDLTKKDGARYGSLTVPGNEWFKAFDLSRVPWVTVSQEIEGESWDLGEWPVSSVELESPGGLVTVGLEDWAARRSRSVSEYQQDMGFGSTVAQFFAHYIGHVVPGGTFSVVRDDTNGAARPYVVRLQVGEDIWRAIHELVTSVGAVPLMTSLSTGELRKFDPYAPYREDVTGTLNRIRHGWDMGNIANRVVARVGSEDSGGGTFVGRKQIGAGSPWAFDRDGIGFCILIEPYSVPKATQAIANAKAQYLYDRRAGAVEAVSMRVVPQPWLEAGDVIAWEPPPGTADPEPGDLLIRDKGMIDSIEYPLRADQAMNIRLRGIPVI